MKRPTRYDDCVKRRAAELALPQVKSWLGEGFNPTDEEIMEDMMDSIDEGDGFAIVEHLKRRHHWEVDSELVEIMEGWFISSAQEELEKHWVKCLGVTLDIPIGAQVKIKRIMDQKNVQGEVVKHYPETAKYGVRTPDQKDNSNWILLPEDLDVTA